MMIRILAAALLSLGASALTFEKESSYLQYAADKGPKRAYVTLLVNDQNDDSYVKAAAALAYRLKETKSKYPLFVAITKNISHTSKCQLKAAGAMLKEIPEIMDECPSPLPVCDQSKDSYNRRWVSQFTKMNLWKWTEFDQLAFYDVDHLIVNSPDDVFEKCQQDFCTAVDESQGGFFVLKPNKEIAKELHSAYENAKIANWTYLGEKMWNEQPLLVKFFQQKMGKLPFAFSSLYHASNYMGVPPFFQMKAIHSKFWVEPLTPGRNMWYEAVNKVNEQVSKKCASFKNLEKITHTEMLQDFVQQASSGTPLQQIKVKGFR